MLYRVLGDTEYFQYQIHNGIFSNNYFNEIYKIAKSDRLLKTDLDDIISHISKGNTTTSSWISASKDLRKVITNYTVSKKDIFKEMRSPIAVIRGYDDSTFIIKGTPYNLLTHENVGCVKLHTKEFRNYPSSVVEKLVIDYTDHDLIATLYDCHFILKKDGEEAKAISRQYNYANSSSEVLIYSSIEDKKSDDIHKLHMGKIPLIMQPLTYDVLHVLMENNSLLEENVYKFYKLQNKLKSIKVDLNEEEKKLFNLHYDKNYTLEYLAISPEIVVEDKFDSFDKLVDCKREIINKYLNKLGFNFNYVPVLEDNSEVKEVKRKIKTNN